MYHPFQIASWSALSRLALTEWNGLNYSPRAPERTIASKIQQYKSTSRKFLFFLRIQLIWFRNFLSLLWKEAIPGHLLGTLHRVGSCLLNSKGIAHLGGLWMQYAENFPDILGLPNRQDLLPALNTHTHTHTHTTEPQLKDSWWVTILSKCRTSKRTLSQTEGNLIKELTNPIEQKVSWTFPKW